MTNDKWKIANIKFRPPSFALCHTQCARRDSNPPLRFKKPVLRHQSFGRVALAAGFEPALTALEEQRLIPLGHASIQTSNGIDEIRTRVILIDNQVPLPLGHDPNWR